MNSPRPARHDADRAATPPPENAKPPKKDLGEQPAPPDEVGPDDDNRETNAQADHPGKRDKAEESRDGEDARVPGAEESGIPQRFVQALFNATGHHLDRVDSSGALAYGAGATAIKHQYIGTAARPEFRLEQRTERSLQDELATHVAGSSDKLLAERLTDIRLVCLLGEPRSGRTHAALAALVDRHGAGGVADLIGPADAPLAAAIRSEDLLADHCGHLLRLDATQLNRRELIDLESIARRHDASVVILADETGDNSDLARLLVRHRPPDPVDVFKTRLRHLLIRTEACAPCCRARRATCPTSCIEAYIAWCLGYVRFRGELSAVHRPQEATMLASTIADGRVDDEEGLMEALASLSTQRIESARELLAAPKEPDEVKRRWLRAFRIAYTVLNDCPRATITAAAADLFTKLRPAESPTTAPASRTAPTGSAPDGEADRIPDISFDVLVPASMHDRRCGDEEADAAPSTSRIMSAILNIAWNDYPSTPHALVAWLGKLVRHRSARVRSRAAVIAGYFAGFERDLVLGELIGGWAKDARAGTRQAAALACVFAAQDQRMTQPVTERVREWVRAGPLSARDTVARAYGAGLGDHVSMRMSLRHLRRIAVDDRYWYSPMVAVAMNRLLTRETTPLIVAELLEWLESNLMALTIHAARSMAAIAGHTTQASLIGWPTMLTWSGDDPARLDKLCELWRTALLLPPSAFAAWRTLEGWIHAAGFDPRLEEIVLAVADRICTTAPIRERMRFHLDRVWSRRRPRYPTNAKISNILTEVNQ